MDMDNLICSCPRFFAANLTPTLTPTPPNFLHHYSPLTHFYIYIIGQTEKRSES